MLGDVRLIEIFDGGLRCKRPTEVYSRVCGFFRPVQAWNLGKKEEYKERVVFKATLLALALLLPAPAEAAHRYQEKVYQGWWCAERGGVIEVIQEDGTRVDCLTTTHAVEFDFAAKWAEAIGQALHYGRTTGKRGAVVLILEDGKDVDYWARLVADIYHYQLPVDLWTVTAGDYLGK